MTTYHCVHGVRIAFAVFSAALDVLHLVGVGPGEVAPAVDFGVHAGF